MGSARDGVMNDSGCLVCRCDLEARIATYRALADLFAGDAEEVREAVLRLDKAGAWCSLVYFDENEIEILAASARAAACDPDEVARFCAERRSLIGDGAFDPFVNAVSPCSATYLAADSDMLADDVTRLYQKHGYAVRFELPCVSHIAAELDFIRHLLERVVTGETASAEAAPAFFDRHIAGWTLLFAIAFGDHARHPIARYAAVALDRFVSCESRLMRHVVPEKCIQRLMAQPS